MKRFGLLFIMIAVLMLAFAIPVSAEAELSGLEFNDVPENAWYCDYVYDLASMAIINGYDDGTFKPDKYITRAEAMTLVNRVLNRRTHAEDMLDEMVKWPDNATWAWYYEAVQEATNGHEYEPRQNPATDYEVWTAIQEPRDWAALEKEWTQAADNLAKQKAAAN